jgi:hypothetical protein
MVVSIDKLNSAIDRIVQLSRAHGPVVASAIVRMKMIGINDSGIGKVAKYLSNDLNDSGLSTKAAQSQFLIPPTPPPVGIMSPYYAGAPYTPVQPISPLSPRLGHVPGPGIAPVEEAKPSGPGVAKALSLLGALGLLGWDLLLRDKTKLRNAGFVRKYWPMLLAAGLAAYGLLG